MIRYLHICTWLYYNMVCVRVCVCVSVCVSVLNYLLQLYNWKMEELRTKFKLLNGQ